MTTGRKLFILIVVSVALAGVSVYAVLNARHAGPLAEPVSLDAGDQVLFRDMRMQNHVSSSIDGDRDVSDASCMRFYASSGTGICMRDRGGLVPAYDAVVLNRTFGAGLKLPVVGTPSRARVSPSGRMAAWTMFISGESYTGVDFTTRTGILDTRTGTHIDNLESFSVHGVRKTQDINIWGVTFADDDRIYATLANRSKTYLVVGSVKERSLTTLKENVECPSLSPDGSRLVYKKRVRTIASGRPWQLHVLDLKTLQERPIAEKRSIDDQVAWQGDGTLLYSVAREGGSDIWTVSADGDAAPALLVRDAQSPSAG